MEEEKEAMFSLNSTNLKDEQKVSIKDVLQASAPNGRTIKSSTVFIAAFKHLQKEAKKYLKKAKVTKKIFKNCQDSDIQWIITVPAIWNDAAKLQMRQWTIDAGLVDPNIHDQCKIVYEADCASLALQYEINKSKNQIGFSNIRNFTDDSEDDHDEKKEEDVESVDYEIESDLHDINVRLRKGEKYILIDVGGGTADIACHEILGEDGEYGVKELLPPSGGPWGSQYIDHQFVKVLEEVFTKEWIDDFRMEYPNVYVSLMHHFQAAKENFHVKFEDMDVRLPKEFVEFIQDKIEEYDDEDDEKENPAEDVIINVKDFISKAIVFEQPELLNICSLCYLSLFLRYIILYIVKYGYCLRD